MIENIDEVISLVEKAQSKETFSLEKAIKGAGHPEDTVDIYLDVDSAYKLSKISEQLSLETDDKKVKELEKTAEELKAKILESKLTFHMRGVDQNNVEKIENEAKAKAEKEGLTDDTWLLYYMSGLVASNLVRVVNAAGEVDERVFTMDDIENLRGGISPDAWMALSETMQKLTLATSYFKELTDTGFLQKS